MARWLLAALLLTLAAVARPATAGDDSSQCAIIHGEGFAYAIRVPDGWDSACHVEESLGVSVAIWPRGEEFQDASAVMYFTQNGDRSVPLATFAERELASFRAKHPGKIKAKTVDPLPTADGRKAVVRQIDDPGNGQYDEIAYADGGSVVVMIVLTAHTPAGRASRRDDFAALVRSFMAMDVVQPRGQ
jgi:hypothetical protein